MRLVSYDAEGGWRSGIEVGDVIADAQRAAAHAGWGDEKCAGLHSTRALVALEPARLRALGDHAVSSRSELEAVGALHPREFRAARPPGSGPAQDHLPRAQLPRSRRGGRAHAARRADVLREVGELARRPDRADRASRPSPTRSTTRPSSRSSSAAREGTSTLPTPSSTSPAQWRSTTSAPATCSSPI